MLRNVEACFQDGESIRNTFVRPNEVCLATANRADVFFKAPRDSAGRVFTVIAQEEILHTDNFQGRLQRAVARGLAAFGPANPGPVDVVVAHVHVRGTPVEGGDFDVMSLRDKLPPVPPYLQPISDEETRIPAAEARARGVAAGSHRTRVVSYTGYGAGTWPTIEVPESYASAHPELRNLTWADTAASVCCWRRTHGRWRSIPSWICERPGSRRRRGSTPPTIPPGAGRWWIPPRSGCSTTRH